MPLVNTKEMLAKACKDRYAVGAFNVINMEIVQGIFEAAAELRAPLILQVSAGGWKYARNSYLNKLVEAALSESELPIALHLDHGSEYEICKACVDSGFTSVMIDGSSFPLERNIEVTREVVKYAHARGVTVEGELGKLAGIEADEPAQGGADGLFTNPDEAVEFVGKTGVDSLAVAIGTTHGAYKFTSEPMLRFDILAEVKRRLPGIPIVLHGASSVPQQFVSQINQYGGRLPEARGVPEEMLRKAVSMAVCKVNFDSDIRLAVTAAVRRHLAENPDHFDPRQYLAPARACVRDIVRHKIQAVLGCAGKA